MLSDIKPSAKICFKIESSLEFNRADVSTLKQYSKCSSLRKKKWYIPSIPFLAMFMTDTLSSTNQNSLRLSPPPSMGEGKGGGGYPNPCPPHLYLLPPRGEEVLCGVIF
jgi:hypothetical protein